MQRQRVTKRKPTGDGPPSPRNENAVAGVGARNGAKVDGLGKRADARNRAARPPLASALFAVLDRDGFVCGVFAGRTAARTFLQGGCA